MCPLFTLALGLFSINKVEPFGFDLTIHKGTDKAGTGEGDMYETLSNGRKRGG